jgi:DNA-binding beta-propeller fold protein YncE
VPPSGDWTAVTLAERGEVIIISPTGAVTRTIKAGGRPTAVAADNSRIAVLDASQSSLTVFDAATGAKQEALRAGDGAATITADGTGRFVVVDARDGELLVFETGPLVLRQRHPVPGSPYGVGYDPTRRTLWVTVTQRNEVAGYDLTGGAPREIARHPSVRLPVAVSVDPPTGTVVVAGSAEGVVQRIPA